MPLFFRSGGELAVREAHARSVFVFEFDLVCTDTHIQQTRLIDRRPVISEAVLRTLFLNRNAVVVQTDAPEEIL